jgi:hypothetical protein
MANAARTKLTKLSNQYSDNVKKVRALKEERRNRGAGVSDAEAKRLNGLINTLDAERATISAEMNKLTKLEKTVKDYTNLQNDIKETQAQIDKATARGESTDALNTKIKGLRIKVDAIAPQVEKEFPELKAVPKADSKVAKGPLIATDTATTKAATDKAAADKAAAAKAAANKIKKPTTKPGAVVPKGFDVGTFRAADEASMAKAGGTLTGTKTATGAEDINAIYTLARSKYGNVDSIFLYDPELRQLLIDAVGDPTTAVGDMDPEEFARRLAASDWAIRNSTTYAKRDAERRQYTETLDKYNEQLKLADTQDKKDVILAKIGQLNTTSSYARGLASAKAYIESVASGLTGTMDPARLDAFVKRMYDSANDKDPNIINRELSALISYKPGNQLGGAIGGDLVTLRATAKANGFDLDKTFGDQINGWLQRLAKGESVETFKNVIRSQAKLGLPDKVSNLLDQGLDLANIYEPYKRLMANVLELAPDAIDLNDATLRSAIGADKEMSLYEFQRTLRKDSRWQYTDNARADVSSSVLQVLRDFGFQG